jgi:hypothetical protein
VTAGTLASPAAVAQPIGDAPARVPANGATPVVVEPEPAPADAPTIVRPTDSGFDWGAAAIGAGGAGALIVLVSLGGLVHPSRDRTQGHVMEVLQNKRNREQRRET